MSSTETAVPSASGTRHLGGGIYWRTTVLVGTALLVAACVAAVIAAIVPSRQVIQGLPDAGETVEVLLPAVTGIFNMMAAITIGWLLGAAVLAPPKRSGTVDVGGYRALRAASIAAWVWAAASIAMIPLTIADALGRPLAEALGADTFFTALSVITAVKGSLISAIIAVVIAVAARSVLRMGWVFFLLGLALFALFPVAMGGHAGQISDHDFAVDSMIFHLFGAALWVGGLIAMIGLAKQRIRHLNTMVQRYSTIALVCFAAVALSGIINAMIRVNGPAQMFGTPYGRLVAIKILLTLALGIFGYIHRKALIPKITSDGSRRPFIQFASVEVAIMAATIGVAATLSRTAAPAYDGIAPLTDAARVLGYDPPSPLALGPLFTFWRFDLTAGTVGVVAAALYIAGVRKLRKRGDTWPAGRTISWLIGCVTLVWATSSGMSAYGLSVFSMHMIQHMFLAMLIPVFFALGGPVSLLLRAIPPAGRDNPPGVREAVVGFVHSPATKMLTHPLVVMPLFVVSFYVLYFTSLFDVMISSHPGHLFMTAHFLLTGYLYYWVISGVDPSPRQLSYPVKLAVVIAPMPFHAFFGLALMSSHHLLGADYFHRLALPWIDDLLKNQQVGGAIGWGFTEVPLVIVMLALMMQWARSDDRLSRREDRKEELMHDADLHAYNAMLAQLAKNDAEVGQRS